ACARGPWRQSLNLAAPGSFCFTIARTRHFDERLLTAVRSGLTQLVLLGAAYDSSPIRFRKELQGCASLSAGAQEAAPGLYRSTSPGNAFRQHLPSIPAQKAFFLREGVCYYLPRSVVENVSISSARGAPGSSIVFDYATRAFVAVTPAPTAASRWHAGLRRLPSRSCSAWTPARSRRLSPGG